MDEDVDINKVHSKLNEDVREHTTQKAEFLEGLYGNALNAFNRYREATTGGSVDAYNNLVLTKKQLDDEFEKWLDEEDRLEEEKRRVAKLMRRR